MYVFLVRFLTTKATVHGKAFHFECGTLLLIIMSVLYNVLRKYALCQQMCGKEGGVGWLCTGQKEVALLLGHKSFSRHLHVPFSFRKWT